jgi:hypothetical protein
MNIVLLCVCTGTSEINCTEIMKVLVYHDTLMNISIFRPHKEVEEFYLQGYNMV